MRPSRSRPTRDWPRCTVLAERQNDFPGVKQEPVSIRSYPLWRIGCPGARSRRPDSEEELEAAGLQGRASRAPSSGSRVSSTTTTAICAASRESGSCRSTRKVEPEPTQAADRRANGRSRPQADDRPGAPAGGRKGAARRGGARPGERQPAARRRRSWRWTRSTAKSMRWAPTRAMTPTVSPNR